ncbi:MAG TPA: alpha/beta fold hydrolase, partial [Telluria sp.]|nr:alpha/beta fold hydrolase [Telluria sp.]
GGPFGVYDGWFFDTDAQFLASRGYAVLQVNYRGSGGRGTGFEHAGYREWGGKLIDDLADGVAWAGTQPGIDTSRACAYGWSYGGYAALMLAVRYPTMFKCAISAAGVSDLPRMYGEDSVKGEKQAEAFFAKTMGTDKATLEAISPARLAGKIAIPVMLVHGTKDKTVPLAHSEMMRDALAKAGRPVEVYLEVPNEGHGFYDSEHQKAFYIKLEAFLTKHIGK